MLLKYENIMKTHKYIKFIKFLKFINFKDFMYFMYSYVVLYVNNILLIIYKFI